MSTKISLGKYGENLASQYYKTRGYKIIAENYYCAYGELDLVVQKSSKIKIVEVKTRKSNDFGWAEESISEQKIKNLIKSYQCLQKTKKLTDYCEIEIFIIEIGQKTKIIKFAL